MKLGKDTIFRQTEEKDRDSIKELLNLSFGPVYAKYATLSFESLEQSLVAEENVKVVGVINWRLFQAEMEKMGYIFWLAVHPVFRRTGSGEELLRRALDILNQQYLPVILTSITKHNLPSRSLFEKLGFKRISKADMRRRLGSDTPRLYRELWIMPWEDVFIKFV